jgi:hypothetical protein
VADYEALKNKQTELIRKALDGSVFVADVGADAIGSLTSYSAVATAGKVVGSADAVNIVTGGNLFLAIDGSQFGVALTTADTPATVVTKINAAVGAAATASLVASDLQVESASTGAGSSVRVVGGTGTVLANLFLTAGQVGYGVGADIELAVLPATYDDLGWLTSDGAQFSRDVSASEVNSWGSVSPTRTDITSDTTTLTVTAQETKLLTIGMATGADLSGITAAFQTGEVSIAKPSRPKSKHYRVLSLAVDQGDAGEIYVARFLPRAKVTSYAEQSFSGGDDPITWGVTFTGEEDSNLGYSERWIFAGAGWNAIVADMGFTQETS